MTIRIPSPRAGRGASFAAFVVVVAIASTAFVGATPATGHFVLSHQGTVGDRVTGLGWQADGSATKMNFAAATAYCSDLGLAGAGDYRLPTLGELMTIVDETRVDPAIDTNYFTGAEVERFWTSTPGASGNHWRVHFGVGDAYDEPDTSEFYVRCVH